MFKSSLIAGALAGMLTLGAPAAATPVSIDLTFGGLDIPVGERVRVKAPLNRVTVTAGGFSMSDGTQSFLAWCIDLFDAIRSDTYSVERPGHLTDATEAELNRLFTNNLSQAQPNPTTSAAFQLAIWEIVYETKPGYNVRKGAFSASHNGPALDLAQTWLEDLGEAKGTTTLEFFTSDGSQDLVTGVVPLPAGLVLLLSGLGIMGIARFRRTA